LWHRALFDDVVPTLGHLHPAAVTDLQIEEIIDAVAQRGKAAMARHLLRTSLSQSACPG
jgi:hypothetical protein